jgi:hypothetical protein
MLSRHAYFIYRSKEFLSTFAFSCILFVKERHFLLGVTDMADVTQYITSFPILYIHKILQKKQFLPTRLLRVTVLHKSSSKLGPHRIPQHITKGQNPIWIEKNQ